MFALMIALVTAPALSGPGATNPAGTPHDGVTSLPSIRVSLNGGDYSPGDEVRVVVEPGSDGHLVVFQVDGDGRVRVLFPLDPDIDAYVRGGRRYEIRGRGERSTFLADDIGGTGLIYAALSRSPMNFRDYVAGDRWDYGMLRLRSDDDPEAELSSMVRRMATNDRFDYDIVGYRVHDTRVYAGGGSHSGRQGYDPYYDCLACGYPIGSGASIRIGSGYGWYDPYDPWFYGDAGYGYYRYGSPYGYGYGYPYGYRGYDPYRPIVVYPTRPRPVATLAPYGYRSRSPQGMSSVPSAFAPDLGGNLRPSPRPGPVESYDGRSRVRNTSAGTSNPASTSGRSGRTETPSREAPPARAPQREPQRQPIPAARPASPAPSSGGSEGRSRKPNNGSDEERAMTLPSMNGEQAGQRTVAPEGRPIFRESPPVTRRTDQEPVRADDVARERPVYREPPRTTPQAEPQRPMRSEPRESPRAEQPARRDPAREAPRPSSTPQREAPRTERPASPPRAERPAPQPQSQPRAERPAPQPQPSSRAPEPAPRSRRPVN